MTPNRSPMARRAQHRARPVVAAILGVAFLSAGATAQVAGGKLDRSKVPAVAASPITKIPTWTRSKLANGAELIVSVKKDLPLVAFTMSFVGGATSFEPADRLGVALRSEERRVGKECRL